jgi:heptosyltransferase-2
LLISGIENISVINSLLLKFSNDNLVYIDTDNSLLDFAALIKRVNYLITSDSLAMHLAIAQKIRFLAFFAPTSAAEIDAYDYGVKLLSTENDYCSYRPHASNKSITATRIINHLRLAI